MNANNLDMSSTGFKCGLVVMLDCDTARDMLENEMHVHQHRGYYATAVYEFGIHEGEPAHGVDDLFEFDESITERDYRRALFSVHMRDRFYTTWKPTPRNFFDEHADRGGDDTYWHDAFMEQLNEDFSIAEYAKEESFPIVDELPSEKVRHKYRVKASCGYSQGDYALVLIPDKHGWCGEHQAAIDKAVDNICWNQPVYARLTVVDQETGEEDEIYLNEFLEDYYEWDRDKIMEGLKNMEHPLDPSVIEFVEDNLPEYPTS